MASRARNTAGLFTGKAGDDASLPGFFLPAEPQILAMGPLPEGAFSTLFLLRPAARILHVPLLPCGPARPPAPPPALDRRILQQPLQRTLTEALCLMRPQGFDLVTVPPHQAAQGYAADVESPRFYQELRRVLRPHGLVALSLGGVPVHLDGIRNDKLPLAQVARALVEEGFHFQRSLPFRRETTLLAGQKPLAARRLGLSLGSRTDHFLTRLQKLRIDRATSPQAALTAAPGWWRAENLNRELQRQWRQYLEGFDELCARLGSPFQLAQMGTGFQSFFADAEKAGALLHSFLEAGEGTEAAAALFPVYIGSVARAAPDRDFSWYSEFVLNHSEALQRRWPRTALPLHFSQIVSLRLLEGRKLDPRCYRWIQASEGASQAASSPVSTQVSMRR